MAKYKITGNRPIAGNQPGQTIDDTNLDGANIAALIEAGHLQPTTSKTTKADEATDTEED